MKETDLTLTAVIVKPFSTCAANFQILPVLSFSAGWSQIFHLVSLLIYTLLKDFYCWGLDCFFLCSFEHDRGVRWVQHPAAGDKRIWAAKAPLRPGPSVHTRTESLLAKRLHANAAALWRMLMMTWVNDTEACLCWLMLTILSPGNGQLMVYASYNANLSTDATLCTQRSRVIKPQKTHNFIWHKNKKESLWLAHLKLDFVNIRRISWAQLRLNVVHFIQIFILVF